MQQLKPNIINQIGFAYTVQLAGQEREIHWDGEALSIYGVTDVREAHDLLGAISRLDSFKDAVEALQKLSQAAEKEAGAVARPAPYSGRAPDSPEPAPAPPPPPPAKVTAPPAPKPRPKPEADKPPMTEIPGLDKMVEVNGVPEISEEDRAKLTEKITEVQEISEDVKAGEKRPGLDPSKVQWPANGGGAALLEAFRQKPVGKKGSMTRTEARAQTSFSAGDDYKGHKILTAGVVETHHGEAWSICLDNGDAVLLSLQGTELEYSPAEEAESDVPGVTTPPADQLPEWAGGEDVDKEKTHVELDTSATQTGRTSTDFLTPPDDVMNGVKMAKLIQWIVDNDPAHKPKVDMARMVDHLVHLQPTAKALKNCPTREKIEKRVGKTLKILGLA